MQTIAVVNGGHRRCPCVAEMRRLRLPEHLPLKGKNLAVNALDAPAERIIAEGRVIVAALSLLAFEIDFQSRRSARLDRVQGIRRLCGHRGGSRCGTGLEISLSCHRLCLSRPGYRNFADIEYAGTGEFVGCVHHVLRPTRS